MASISCPKCGAKVEFEADTKFVRCSYCSSLIFIDRSGAGFYYIIPFQVNEGNAIGIFRRWAAGPTKAKDLDKRAQLAGSKRSYFPVYFFKREVEGKETVKVEPAGSTTLPGLHDLKVPAGDLRIFDSKYDVEGVTMVQPDIEMSAYLPKMPGRPKEQSLVYFPIWTIDYTFEQKKYQIIIDGSSGEVFAADFPQRGSAPYLAVAILGFIAFFGETLLTFVAPFLGVVLIAVTVAAVFMASLFVAWRM